MSMSKTMMGDDDSNDDGGISVVLNADITHGYDEFATNDLEEEDYDDAEARLQARFQEAMRRRNERCHRATTGGGSGASSPSSSSSLASPSTSAILVSRSSVDTLDTATMEDPDMPRRTVGDDADNNIGGGGAARTDGEDGTRVTTIASRKDEGVSGQSNGRDRRRQYVVSEGGDEGRNVPPELVPLEAHAGGICRIRQQHRAESATGRLEAEFVARHKRLVRVPVQ
jgi:hypothetical protein